MEREDAIKLTVLFSVIIIMIALGLYLTSPTGYAIANCAELRDSYIVLEPYKEYDYEIRWGEIYLKTLDKLNIFIPRDKPTYISYKLCSPCKYNITFFSSMPTSFFIFDKLNKERYFNRESTFALLYETNSYQKNFTFELGTGGEYYFVFDRSFQGTATNDPATGRLLIYELKGFNYTIEETKYREVKRYRTVTKCE